jgi:3-dehydroquinate synthase
MSNQIDLTTSATRSSYQILVEQDFDRLTQMIPTDVSQIFVVSDSNVAPLYFDAISSKRINSPQLIEIEPGEQYKNIRTVESIWQQLNAASADRNALIINVGGGVITDLGGFAAATYKRGIRFINIPTTLLAQVDAAVGGKTGINFAGLKNNIGTFTQPTGVYCNTSCLSTLSDRVFVEGFGEIIKHAVITKNTILHDLKENVFDKNGAEKLTKLVAKSVQVKVDVVALDEREANQRKVLNFGHTFGHALESLSHHTFKPLLHGEAVGLGMLGELYAAGLSELVDVVSELLVQYNLPTRLDVGIEPEEFLVAIRGDKKNHSGEIQWAIPREIGQVITDYKIDEESVLGALKWLDRS